MYLAPMTDALTPDLSDDELLALTCPIIYSAGSSFYFTPATVARGAELGLDQFGFYALGRGGVLGDVESAVVSSAFGYFNPSLVAALWNANRDKVSPRIAGTAFMECCGEHGRLRLSDIDGLDEFVAAGEKVLGATDGDAFALFAATAAEQRATDAPAHAMQLVTVLREYRGCAHLVAIRAVGLDTRTAHHVTRPNDVAMFGWSPEQAPVVDDAVREKMARVESLTDDIVRPAFAVLDAEERDVFVRVLRDIGAAVAA
jgi:hypothetical protein